VISRRLMLSAGGAALLLSACETQRPVPDGTFPLMALIDDDETISEFRAALRRSGLDQTLQGQGPFTVFAPTNSAWAVAPQALKEGRPEAVRALIANGRLRLPEIQARNGVVRMLSGNEVRLVGGEPTRPRIQYAAAGRPPAPNAPSATIVRPNLLASNGVIHVIDQPLVPA